MLWTIYVNIVYQMVANKEKKIVEFILNQFLRIDIKNCYSPEMAKPEKPTANVRHMIANVVLSVLPTRIRKNASIPKPPQLNTLRTFVVVSCPDRRRKSAR